MQSHSWLCICPSPLLHDLLCSSASSGRHAYCSGHTVRLASDVFESIESFTETVDIHTEAQARNCLQRPWQDAIVDGHGSQRLCRRGAGCGRLAYLRSSTGLRSRRCTWCCGSHPQRLHCAFLQSRSGPPAERAPTRKTGICRIWSGSGRSLRRERSPRSAPGGYRAMARG